MPCVRIAVVYHSGMGHTTRLARSVAAGAMSIEGSEVAVLPIKREEEPDWACLEAAEAIIFGTPTYMGGPSATFKFFQEATSKRIFASGLQWRNKLAAGFTVSASRSGDKLGTLIQLALFAAQHGMHWVNLALLPGHHSSDGSETDLNRLGFFLGAAAQANSDEPPEKAPPQADLETGYHLGARVAALASYVASGRASVGAELYPETTNTH